MTNPVSINLKDKLEKYFGFSTFKSEQETIVQNVVQGRDTFVIMPTGGGKSLCYQLPAMILDGTALVISPLIALMKNQVDAIRSLSNEDSIAHFLNSSLNKTQIKQVRADVMEGKTKLLYIAPETLTKEENIEFFGSVNVSFVAIDEAHCISEWGHDFRPEYRKIRDMIDRIGKERKIPILALTATATPKVRQDIIKILEMTDCDEYITSFNRTNLFYEIRPKKSKDSTTKEIIQYIKALGEVSGIIYFRNRKSTEELAHLLKLNGINAAPYHAGLDSTTRSDTQDAFLKEEVNVICATIAFGMGIDKPDVRFVIHFDMPKSIENYYQETGRAGRDGILSYCLAFYSPKEMQNLEKFLRDKSVAERELGLMLINEVVDYAETGACRRVFLLNYFGESYSEELCNELCDNCKSPPLKREIGQQMTAFLNTVLELNENCDAKFLLNYMLGNKTQRMQTFGFDKNETFGFGEEEGAVFWESCIRQAIIRGFVSRSLERYGVLTLTPAGHKFLSDPPRLEIPINRTFQDADVDIAPAPVGGALDNTLLKILKQERDRIAKRNNLPRYIIFQDPSLEDMATRYPITEEDMMAVSGVNLGKAKKYGDSFLEIIRDYVEQNDIERSEDLVIKTTANKSKDKVTIIQGIDQQKPLKDIANTIGISEDELMSEIYQIVISGTKLDINYILTEELDESTLDDIMDYFLESETDSLEDALAELEEDDISIEEIRLVRIKFLSDYGN